MIEEDIRKYFICPACRRAGLEVVPFEKEGAGLIDAVVLCPACRAWYRLEGGLPELLTSALRDDAARGAFRRRFLSRWSGWDSVASEGARSSQGDSHKLEQKSFYDQDAIQYETQMLRLPFWKAFDRTYLGGIPARLAGEDVLLEIGGGTGRMSLPVRERFKTILSFDLSEAMVRAALRQRDALGPGAAHAHYFVADAENIPLKPGAADVASLSGILHHVESPGAVIAEMARVLKPGGLFFGNENNRSAFRFIFDALMRIRKLWNEKAHEEHFIISPAELDRWFADSGVTARLWTSVFLPPHLFNLLSEGSATRLLRSSDALAQAIPWFRSQGGLVLYSGRKPASKNTRI